MAIPSIAATSPSLIPLPSIEAIRGAFLVRPSGRSLLGGDPFAVTDTVEVSATGRLLSSVAEIVDAAETAGQGTAVNTESVVENVQTFVDSVNAVNLDNEFVLSDLLDANLVPAPATPQAEALGAVGINVLPLGAGGDSFILSLDTAVLENALETDPAGTSGQLANATVPFAAAAAAQAGAAPVTSSLAQGTLALVAAGRSASGLLAPNVLAGTDTPIDSVRSVVPDLTLENAELRRIAVADRLMGNIADDAVSAAETPVTVLPAEEAITDTDTLLASPLLAVTEAQAVADTVTVAEVEREGRMLLQLVRNARVSEDVRAALAAANPVTPVSVLADAQAQMLLTPSALLTTPLEQIARLAVSPTLAGAVAAFQVPADDGNWAARMGVQGDLDVINPMAAVLQTKAIAPNLANSSNERQEGSTDARLNQWLSSRVARRGLINALPEPQRFI